MKTRITCFSIALITLAGVVFLLAPSWMAQGLLVEAIGIVVEISFVVLIYTWYSNWSENKKWFPAREQLAHYIQSQHVDIFHTIYEIAKQDSDRFSYPPSLRYSKDTHGNEEWELKKAYVEHLSATNSPLNRIDEKINFYTASLDAEMMNVCSLLVENYGTVIDYFSEYASLYNPIESYQVRSDYPKVEMRKIELLVGDLERLYPGYHRKYANKDSSFKNVSVADITSAFEESMEKIKLMKYESSHKK